MRGPGSAESGFERIQDTPAELIVEQRDLWHLGLQSAHHRHRGIRLEVVNDQHLEGTSPNAGVDAAENADDILTFVVGRDHDREGGRQIRPASTSALIQGITSSSTASRPVVALKPSSRQALLTSGTRRCTS